LFNLGGPDRIDAVRPFLFNLFNDPAIIHASPVVRWIIAQLISRRRAPIARDIYAHLGGRSPLLDNTRAQATALGRELVDQGEVGVFIAMRYWHPMAPETVKAVKLFAPDRVILLPLYPQWSTTTSASSLAAWRQAAQQVGLVVPTQLVCCYPTNPGVATANARLIRQALEAARAHGRPRLLLSAHGLPKSVVEGGDPYQWQCEETARAIVQTLDLPDLDWRSCYQSRVGPLEWIGPSTDEEIRQAGVDRVPVVVAPIAFVSEHSETLVEIEVEYRQLAEESGVPYFGRVPAIGIAPEFIGALAGLVRQALATDATIIPGGDDTSCCERFPGCAQALNCGDADADTDWRAKLEQAARQR